MNHSSSPLFSICVYCGSRPGKLAQYEQAAREVGEWIGRHQGQLVYGGGQNGLMGTVASATLAAGGRVVGVTPQSLVDRECAKSDCTELHVVENMHERKRMMMERADAFLALPGGVGTFEELFEVWAWHQLGYHSKPMGLLNVAGYYSPLMTFLATSVSEGFVQPWQMELIQTDDNATLLLQQLVQMAGFGSVTKPQAI